MRVVQIALLLGALLAVHAQPSDSDDVDFTDDNDAKDDDMDDVTPRMDKDEDDDKDEDALDDDIDKDEVSADASDVPFDDAMKTAAAATFDDTANVVTLTDANLRGFLEKYPNAIVDFYAPWCGHCTALEPEWEKAAATLKAEGLATRFAKLDAASSGDNHIIDGYPTIKYYQNGKPKHVKDFSYEAKSIVNVTRRTEFAHMITLKAAGVDELLGGIKKVGSFVLVAHVKRESARAKAYLKAKEELERWPALALRFAVVWLPKTADAKADSSLFMWRPGFEAPDKERHEFTGAWAGGNIVKWAKHGAYGGISRFFNGDMWDPEPLELIGGEVLVAILLDDDSLKASLETQLIAMTKKYPQWKSMVLKKSGLDEKVWEYFDDKKRSGPTLSAMVFSGKLTGPYILGGQAELAKPDAVANFVADVKAGKGKHKLRKSEAVPAVAVDSAGVTTLVADSFDQYVLDPTKAVIVDFSTDDCEDCKKLDPVWKDVAKHMKKLQGSSGVTVAKINVHANHVEKETIEKVPKIVFYPAVKAESKFKKRKVYTRAHDVDGIVAFINDNLEEKEEDEL